VSMIYIIWLCDYWPSMEVHNHDIFL
jgi:hypothetical protein